MKQIVEWELQGETEIVGKPSPPSAVLSATNPT
jgi:hypothetical protein